MGDEKEDEKLWQATYAARQSYFEAMVGPLPDYMIRKAISLTWPGGGVFVIPAARLGQNLAVYTTFGLTNPDMNVGITGSEVHCDASAGFGAEGEIQTGEPAQGRTGVAGYGYELLIVAERGLQWPLRYLFETADWEITGNFGLLAQVEAYDGVTVKGIDVALPEPGNVLISKALEPLPAGTHLPNGFMQLLVATTITDEEMEWSKDRRGTLLQKLRAAGIGQVSTPGRSSIVLD
jgi:hypothetical protein